MTARTHDLFAFASMIVAISYGSLPSMSLATGIAAAAACFLGGLAPDLDEPGSTLWERMPAGSGGILGKIFAPALGSHRFISHSIVGLLIFGFVARKLLELASSVVLVDMNIVWGGFILGYISHLIADGLTREGIPLLFPLPFKFGFPPIGFLRMKSGGYMEKFVVFPGLLFLCAYMVYLNYEKFLLFFRGLV